MSLLRHLETSLPSTCSSAASPVRIRHRRGRARGSKGNEVAFGMSTFDAYVSSALGSPSSKTLPAALSVGSAPCGTTCTCSDIERVPSAFLRSTLARPISEDECSYLLPTPSASRYGSNQGGGAGRVGPDRPSLHTMAKRGLLPTPTVKGNYNRAGEWASSGNGLATEVGGALNPPFLAWLMGFPLDWI